MSVAVDLFRALAQLTDPRFLGVLLRSLAITILGLFAVAAVLLGGLGWLLPETVSLPWIGPVGFLDDLAFWSALGLMLVLSVVLMVPTAAAVVGFLLEDIAAAVEARHYPGLPPAKGAGLGSQFAESLRFLGVVILANLVALVVYLAVPPLAPFVFWGVNGILLGREYSQLVAMRRMPRPAAQALARRNFWRISILGTAMAVPLSVPVLNLVVPILGVAVFTHQVHRMASR